MKKLLVSLVMVLAGVGMASAQGYVVVNTETVFKSIAAFNAAEAELERLGKTRQAEIDAGFDQVETMYNSYMQQKPMLGEAARAQQEKTIIERETALNKRQQDVFGPEGELMKRRTELMKPIEDKVKKAIADYGARSGVLVLDVAQNPMVLYYAPSADRTQEIINLVK
jgi:outer membrane protein